MNRFIKSSLLVGALLTVTGVSFSAPAQADNNQQKYLNNLAVQMYANNVANGMSPLTGGIYSPYVNGTIYGNNNINNNGRHHRRNRYNNYNNYNNGNYNNRNYNNDGYNTNYYNSNYGYQPYGYGTQYYGNSGRPSIFSQLINGSGY
ncbi:hypothetical protein BH10CYA1_BH10CYA1_11370 [soil metagenome]